jgi:hypothetical protein
MKRILIVHVGQLEEVQYKNITLQLQTLNISFMQQWPQ